MMVVEKALRTSNSIMKVISNNLLAFKISSYLDTNTLDSLKLYLETINTSIQQPSDYIESEILSSMANPALALLNCILSVLLITQSLELES